MEDIVNHRGMSR